MLLSATRAGRARCSSSGATWSATPNDAGVLAGASAVVFVLVMLRLTGLARAQAVNARREQALRSFSERLVAATERSDVWNAAVDAVVAIGAAGVIGCVVTDVREPARRSWPPPGPTSSATAVDVTALDGRAIGERSASPRRTAAATPRATIWTAARACSKRRRLVSGCCSLTTGRSPLISGRSSMPIAAQLTLALGRVELARVVHEARTERRFQSMVQYSSDLITLLGADRRVIYQSPAVGGRARPLAERDHRASARANSSIPTTCSPLQAQFTKVLTGGLGASVDASNTA